MTLEIHTVQSNSKTPGRVPKLLSPPPPPHCHPNSCFEPLSSRITSIGIILSLSGSEDLQRTY